MKKKKKTIILKIYTINNNIKLMLVKNKVIFKTNNMVNLL